MTALVIGLVLAACIVRAQSVQTGYSSDALYNLANSYARAGKPGMAILNYERAAMLAPDDADVAANLRAVRASAGLPAEPQAWLEPIERAARPATWAWSALIGVLAVGSSALAARLTARFRSLRRMAAVAGVALLGLTIVNGVIEWPRLHAAVVLVAGTPARATPAPMAEPLFSLPEGQTVRLLGEHEDFVFVQVTTGDRGWVSRASLATVVP